MASANKTSFDAKTMENCSKESSNTFHQCVKTQLYSDVKSRLFAPQVSTQSKVKLWEE